MNLQPSTQKQEREYLHTLSAGALLPFAQATGFALVIFIAAYVIAAVTFNAMDPYKPALLFAVIAWVAMLWRLFRHWLALTMPVIEYAARDLADDGKLNNSAQPAAEEDPRRVIRVQLTHVKDGGHIRQDEFDLPCDDFQLSTLAKGLTLTNAPFTERYWVRQQKLFSRDEWDALRAAMLNRDEPLIEYIDPQNKQQGMRVTAAGMEAMKKFADLPHSPTAEEES